MANPHAPFVSVIIAFLNEEKFLTEAVESVLAQDYPHWELILVDDGSTDSSSAIAKTYAQRFTGKIFYLEHEGHRNKGLSASRNHGIAHAKGELLAFLDADDVWLPGKLTNQVAIFQRHPEISMVAEASDYWYSWDKADAENVAIAVGAPQDKVYQPTELLYHLYPLSAGAAPCPSGLMLKKAAILRVGGFEESFTGKYQLYEDQGFLNKVYLKEKVYISSACNNLYRQRTGSIVQWVHADGHYNDVRVYFLKWFEAYLQREHVEDEGVQKLLKKAWHPYRHPKLHYLTEVLPGKVKQLFQNKT
ncbi:glycosyltransferase family 2 protein [Pontibacter diazotrophicus]|uniref:Glycosyltransferase family 2 protein n=1 Tax=Pontibacter diazotrophicus TaxID=1400979 RepID=A0A3D8LGX8_9BACT|nr:glycosyltransferase family 2 protein [Pontibacter diazotrophicus]RDV16709.1 glycosyltransferase family 2 protein [Pontibacter diazotrophicus]